MSRLSPLLRPLLLLAGLVVIVWLLRAMPRDVLAASAATFSRGAVGAVWFVLAGAGLCAAGLPRQAVAYAGGYIFGLAGGGALAMAAQLLGCALALAWARLVGRDWARRRLGARLRRLDATLAAQPFRATLMLRLLPVGNNLLLTLLAGVSSVAVLPFLAGSALGYLPQTLVFALAGGGTRLGGGAELWLGAALFVAAAVLGAGLWRRLRCETPATAAALSADGADASYAATPRP